MQKMLWFISGMLMGLTALSITKAAVPTNSRVTDDTVIYQNLREIRVPKHGKLDFDGDIRRLSELENQVRYREELPSLGNRSRLRAPLQRVAQQKYRHRRAR